MRLYCERCLNDKVDVFQDPDDSEDGEWLCKNCRDNEAEAAYDRHQQWLMENGPGPTLLEQQEVARKLK